MPASRTPVIDQLRRISGSSLGYKPYKPPSQWIAENGWIDGAVVGTGFDQRFDIWRFPCNVGIVDAFAEGKRSIYVMKAVQMAVSHYVQMAVCWWVARFGGQVGYSMDKLEKVRDHVLDRFDVMLEHSDELRETFLPGRDNHETIFSKRFTNATLKFFGAQSEKNFKGNPYDLAVADEFEQMPVFPNGSDAVQLFKGRQDAKLWPLFVGFSSPLDEDKGIDKYTKAESDMRRFYWRCPHCCDAITVSFLENVSMDAVKGSQRRIAATARLLCPRCGAVISDADRAAALVKAAQAACEWYSKEPYDAEVGWKSTLSPDEAGKRTAIGFVGLDQMHNPAKTIAEIAERVLSAEVLGGMQLKTAHNDVLGRPYTIRTGQVDRRTVEDHKASQKRLTLPDGTQFITFGADVQGGGKDPALRTFYYDVSAWVLADWRIRKVTLQIDRIISTAKDGHETIKRLIREWAIPVDRNGNVRRLDMAVIDGGWDAETINSICNALSGTNRRQWAMPCVYGSIRVGEAEYQLKPQNEAIGDPSRAFLLTSRDYAVQCMVDMLTSEHDLVELPAGVSEEVIQHYTSNEQKERIVRHGVTEMHWQKKLGEDKRTLPDDWFQAGCYSLLAAKLLGLDNTIEARIAEADTEAAKRVVRVAASAQPKPSQARRRDRIVSRIGRRYGH